MPRERKIKKNTEMLIINGCICVTRAILLCLYVLRLKS